jgi:acetoin utilization deacetylase AcuC-like enzyme
MLAFAAPRLPSVDVVQDFAAATPETLRWFHTPAYLSSAEAAAADRYRAGLMAAGAAVELSRRVWAGEVTNGYALTRPAGHHSEPAKAGGNCMFANGVLAALQAQRSGARRVLFLDWDAHHGNSQQTAFWRDPSVLTISVHQGRAFAPGTGGSDARGAGPGFGANLNVGVPMGSGGGVYRAVFDRVIRPAAERYRPDMVIAACGFDGSYLDPSARLALHAEDYGWMAAQARSIAVAHAGGRLLLTHEGGYSLPYLPLCFLRVIERLSGDDTGIDDPFLRHWGRDFAAAVTAEAEAVIAAAAAQVADVPCGSAGG